MGVGWAGNGREETKAIFPREVYKDLETKMQFISGTAHRARVQD